MPEGLEAGLPTPTLCVLKSSCLITATLSLHPSTCVCVHPQAMWLYLAALVGLYYLLRWYRERQVVSHLRDKYVFITGCDSGFGNLLARQLDTRGLRVLAGCLTEKGAEQLRARTSDRLKTVSLDVTKTESVTAAAQWVKECVGDRGLWGLVNNAGISQSASPNEWLTKQDFVTILDMNLLGVIEVTLSLLPLVRKARGRLVNVSSVMGRLSLSGGGYCISKYGVEAFSDSLRRELAHFGVKVAVIEPGYFKTGMTNTERVLQMAQKNWDKASPEIKEIYGQKILASYLRIISEKHMARCNLNLSEVTGCMEHALTACHPRTRYSAGWDVKLFYLPLSYMPTFLVDAMVTWSLPRPEKAP
ncbi:retinol dehydrogenase 16-like isoform X2 [Nycticebus coucang]|uniref:retinol dehydrogenase 16-like isoform X2 n=1 Tax=Nycticebus coucang TaxID=9470 RepID=UPI00234DCB3B|nr:retinol dehydrogenase 16-like isoform X2 [Nycticebus coucang]